MDEDIILPVEIDPIAAAKLKESVDKEGALGIRIGILGGGCSGYTYLMDFLKEEPTAEDFVSNQWGVRIAVDQYSANHLNGTVIAWEDKLLGGGFKFINPNHKTCGCGESFSQKEG